MKLQLSTRHLTALGIGVVGLAALVIFVYGGRLELLLARIFPSDQVVLGDIVAVSEEANEQDEVSYWVQTLRVRLLTGPEAGTEAQVRHRGTLDSDPRIKLQEGETIVLNKNNDFTIDSYYVADRYRLRPLIMLLALFVAAVLAFARWRGLTSLLGLGASLAILLLFIVPQILQGADPLLVSLGGSAAIALCSLYLAHGFNKRTTIALVGMCTTLLLAVGLTYLFTSVTNLLGVAAEEAFFLQVQAGPLSLHGLLLAGIIIGMLGVLDDITVGQATTVEELKAANPSLDARELYRRGERVGKEHIASLVNTLALAYAGAAFPLFLLLIVQSDQVPLWLAVNGEPIAQEIVRTLIGSLALIAAVPITTCLAAYWYGRTHAAAA